MPSITSNERTVDERVEALLKRWKIPWAIEYFGMEFEQLADGTYVFRDIWCVSLGDQLFRFFTGIGQREKVKWTAAGEKVIRFPLRFRSETFQRRFPDDGRAGLVVPKIARVLECLIADSTLADGWLGNFISELCPEGGKEAVKLLCKKLQIEENTRRLYQVLSRKKIKELADLFGIPL